MIRVLEVLATLKRAGAETMATTLACRLDRKEFSAAVVSLYDSFEGGYEPVLNDCGIAAFHLGKRRGFDLRMFGRLRRLVEEWKPDIVHTHSYVMRYALPVGRCAIVHTVHNVAEREVDFAGRAVHRLAYRWGKAVPVAVAGEVARSFHRMYGFAPRIIPNGIDVARYTTAPRRGGSEPVILSVARLDPQKNPEFLARAFLATGRRARLLFAGGGSLRPQGKGIEILGPRTDIPALLAHADIFALASDWEGHPIAIMEAMAAGLPVVATAVGGVPEIVGDCGLLVPPGDEAALSAALARLLDDHSLRRELGQRSRARAVELFDVSRMVAAYEKLFREVVGR